MHVYFTQPTTVTSLCIAILEDLSVEGNPPLCVTLRLPSLRDSIYDLIGDEASYVLLLEEAAKARGRRELFESERRRLKEIAENSIQLSGTEVGGCGLILYYGV